ncbi:MAG TPA: TadE/TadG family type IV pilus assembly protein [Acidimicrobiales bacterium]|nr:TadE/TadG family type IV pilus assembly protein [Acidimicrobiales bacterium]
MHRDTGGRGDAGATLVEFALVFPIFFVLLCGIIGGCYLAYQNSSLHDGATAGARMASIETSLLDSQTGQGAYCESGLPVPIQTAVANAAPLLKVNPAPLCATSSSATQLTQTSVVNGDVNIVVSCGGSCGNPSTTAVSLTVRTKGLVAPIGITFNLSATSQEPVLSP